MLPRLLLCLLLPLFAAPSLVQAQTPGEIVDKRASNVLSTLVEKRDEFRADSSKLNAFVKSELDVIFDRDYSARLVLARHSRTASPEQIAAFADALTTNLLNRYGAALLEVDGSIEVKVKSETPLRDGKLMRVHSQIDRKGAAPVSIDYLFRDGEAGWKVFDVIVEGISYVQTYRNQFDALLRTESLDKVTRDLAAGAIAVND